MVQKKYSRFKGCGILRVMKYTNENTDQMFMERHLAKKVRRSSKKNHFKGPSKRTEADNQGFEEPFEKMIQKATALAV